ncbi:rho GTPase-activating protein syd-1-like [Oncorhynchus clarkii lewisi]|uniref:rho GTPase-activating protein syd-1-like n=1 Tax=Oncorhynchus clarkii lewisi TaxID=490388 RepID=UPI0039B9C5B7
MVLSVEDVSSPSGVRSMRRVAQAFPDGTLLLELSRPPKGPFGFLISRGKGRPDSGVYVEEMGDSSTVKMYGGLLGVGDELLEVNCEKVAGLSLDLVTRLLTQENIASVRVLRHRRLPPPRYTT